MVCRSLINITNLIPQRLLLLNSSDMQLNTRPFPPTHPCIVIKNIQGEGEKASTSKMFKRSPTSQLKQDPKLKRIQEKEGKRKKMALSSFKMNLFKSLNKGHRSKLSSVLIVIRT
jgi:hypothetical protein